MRQRDLTINQNPKEANRLLELPPSAYVRICEIPLDSSSTCDGKPQVIASKRLGIATERKLLRYLKAIRQLDLQVWVRIKNHFISNEETVVLYSAADVLTATFLAGTQSAAVALALDSNLPVILTERIAAGIQAAFCGLIHIVPACEAVASLQAIQDIL